MSPTLKPGEKGIVGKKYDEVNTRGTKTGKTIENKKPGLRPTKRQGYGWKEK